MSRFINLSPDTSSFGFPAGPRRFHQCSSGFAGPVGTEQAEYLAGVDRKGQIIHRRKRAETAGQAFDFEDNFGHNPKVSLLPGANNGVNTPRISVIASDDDGIYFPPSEVFGEGRWSVRPATINLPSP